MQTEKITSFGDEIVIFLLQVNISIRHKKHIYLAKQLKDINFISISLLRVSFFLPK